MMEVVFSLLHAALTMPATTTPRKIGMRALNGTQSTLYGTSMKERILP
jgi:hypothetical protein